MSARPLVSIMHYMLGCRREAGEGATQSVSSCNLKGKGFTEVGHVPHGPNLFSNQTSQKPTQENNPRFATKNRMHSTYKKDKTQAPLPSVTDILLAVRPVLAPHLGASAVFPSQKPTWVWTGYIRTSPIEVLCQFSSILYWTLSMSPRC